MNSIYTADDEFKDRFARHIENDGKKARYLLSWLERQSIQREGRYLVDELKPDTVTLEHIFPKSPGENWSTELTADPVLPDYVFRLGNLCLLTNVNKALGNKSFAEKREVFAASRLNTTSKIAESETWGREQIETRQRHFAQLAAAYWRFDPA